MGLRSHIHWEGASEQVVVLAPTGGDLWSERRGCPCIHDIGIAGETAGNIALRFGVTSGRIGSRVDRKRCFVSSNGLIVKWRTIGIERIPNGERHAEETLATNEPVAVEAIHPVLVANAHMRRMPVKFFAAFEQRFAKRKIAATVAQIPLTAGEDFEGAIALLEELHRMRDRFWFAIELTVVTQQVNDAHLRLFDGLAGEFGIGGNSSIARAHDPFRSFGLDAAIDADD